jgi:hypothetical protein
LLIGMTSFATSLVTVVAGFVAGTMRRLAARAGAARAVDRGMSTAEYAVGTVAAVAFAVVLYKIVRSDAVSSTLSNIITTALHAI